MVEYHAGALASPFRSKRRRPASTNGDGGDHIIIGYNMTRIPVGISNAARIQGKWRLTIGRWPVTTDETSELDSMERSSLMVAGNQPLCRDSVWIPCVQLDQALVEVNSDGRKWPRFRRARRADPEAARTALPILPSRPPQLLTRSGQPDDVAAFGRAFHSQRRLQGTGAAPSIQ